MVAIYESGLFKGDKDEEHMLRSIGLLPVRTSKRQEKRKKIGKHCVRVVVQ